jgi:hypothetical protein
VIALTQGGGMVRNVNQGSARRFPQQHHSSLGKTPYAGFFHSRTRLYASDSAPMTSVTRAAIASGVKPISSRRSAGFPWVT